MCQSGSRISSLAFILLDIGLAACLVSFFAPFWVQWKSLDANNILDKGVQLISSFGKTVWVEGLWGKCYSEKECIWFWENDFSLEKGFPDWHKAAQGLYLGGVAVIVVAVFMSTFHFCCCCCKGSVASIRSAMGSLTIAAVVCIAASLGVYGGFAYKDGMLDKVDFYWGYYIGIGGVGLALIAALLFICDGCLSRGHTGYQMTRVA